MCSAIERKEMSSENFKKKIYNIHTWYWSSTPLKFKNQDLHDLFLETLFWINLSPAKY